METTRISENISQFADVAHNTFNHITASVQRLQGMKTKDCCVF